MAFTDELTLVEKIYVLLIAGYIGFSGIYWFPGIPYELFAVTKMIIYCIIVILGLMNKPRVTKSLIRIIVGLVVCAVAFISVRSMHSGMLNAIQESRMFVLPLFWLIAISGIKPKAYQFLFRSLTVATTLFLIIAIYPVAAYTGVLPNYHPPTELVPDYASDFDFAMELGSIAGGGFAGQSTSWGIVVPTMALLAAALHSRTDNHLISHSFIVTILILCSIASVAVTSARGGSMALTALWLYGLAKGRGAGRSVMVTLIAIAILWFVVDQFDLLPENYFRGFEFGNNTAETLDTVSTGRIATFLHALDCFDAAPILGVGGPAALYYGLAIHNTFLRILAEGGLVVFLPTIYVGGRLAILAIKKPIRHDFMAALGIKWPDTRLVILVGLIMANVEPGSIFGNFNASTAFWTAVWLAIIRPSPQLVISR